MCLRYYRACKPRKSWCVQATNFSEWGTKLKKAVLFMKDLPQYLYMTYRNTNGDCLDHCFLTIQHFTNMLTTTPSFLVKKTLYQVINNLQTEFRTIIVWFYDNFFVLNPNKVILWLMEIGATFATFHVMI